RGFVLRVIIRTLDKILRVLDHPRMIRGNMVGYEVENQPHISFRKLSSCVGKAFGTSEVLVDHISANAIRRSDVVLRTEVRKCSTEIVKQVRVLISDGNTGRASFPHSHEPQ